MKYEISDLGMHYLGGLLKNIQGASAIMASWVNSYKRLEGKKTEVNGWGDKKEAVKEILESIDMYNRKFLGYFATDSFILDGLKPQIKIYCGWQLP